MKYQVTKTKNISEEELKGWDSDGEWIVIETEIISGERTSAYDSEPDTVIVRYPFSGNISDCNSWIQLKENKQLF